MTDFTHIRDVLRPMAVGQQVQDDAFARFHRDWTCEHERSELRCKINSAGRPMYGRQCVNCGGTVGSWVKKPDAPVPAWDEALATDYWDARSAAYEQARQQQMAALDTAREEQGREWWEWYTAYLTSDAWHRRRALVLQRAGGRCEGCLERSAVHVHHTSYKHVGDELLWELRAVCRECHEKLHPHMREGGAA